MEFNKIPADQPPENERQILIYDGEKFVVGKHGDYSGDGADYHAEDPYYETMHLWQCVWWAELPPIG